MNAEDRKILFEPVVDNNPITLQVLGIRSALAVTGKMQTAFVMMICVTVVVACSSFAISLIRNQIPGSIRIGAQITIIATMVIVVSQVLEAFFAIRRQNVYNFTGFVFHRFPSFQYYVVVLSLLGSDH